MCFHNSSLRIALQRVYTAQVRININSIRKIRFFASLYFTSMFHLFHGKCKHHGDDRYLENDVFGVLVEYQGNQKKWTRYLHPMIDTNHNTIKYYAFDTQVQKQSFLSMLKISGIGGKTAYEIASQDQAILAEAIEGFDIKYFTALPGVWPKTAKRLLVELKTSLDTGDVKKLSIDDSLLKSILKSLHDLGYERSKIKLLLPRCPVVLKKENLPEIMKRLVDNL